MPCVFYATDSKNEHHSDFFSLGDAHEVSFTHKDLNAIVARWVPAGDLYCCNSRIGWYGK